MCICLCLCVNELIRIILCAYREQYNHALSNKMFTPPLPSTSIGDEAAVTGNGETGGDRRSVTDQFEQGFVSPLVWKQTAFQH